MKLKKGKKTMNEEQSRVHRPFSPTIIEYRVPKKNAFKRLEYQSQNLREDRDFTNVIKKFLLGYLENMIANNQHTNGKRMVVVIIQPLIIFTLHSLG